MSDHARHVMDAILQVLPDADGAGDRRATPDGGVRADAQRLSPASGPESVGVRVIDGEPCYSAAFLDRHLYAVPDGRKENEVSVIINPGSGPVLRALYENAVACIAAFAYDVGADSWSSEGAAAERDGRWMFTLKRGDKTAVVEMPGLPLEEVRYMGEPDQNIWHFPRLYVNGSSWIWEFAVGVTFREDDSE